MLIGLKGPAGSGKSTAAQILKAYGFVEDSFAAPLKIFTRAIGFEESEVYGDSKQKEVINNFWGVSGREFMQKFGTDVCREYLPKVINMKLNNKSLWIRVLEKKLSQYDKLVISDVRFANEWEFIKEHKGIIIEIKPMKDVTVNSTTDYTHKSETERDLIIPDHVVVNDFTMDGLEDGLKMVLEREGCVLKKKVCAVCELSSCKGCSIFDYMSEPEANSESDLENDLESDTESEESKTQEIFLEPNPIPKLKLRNKPLFIAEPAIRVLDWLLLFVVFGPFVMAFLSILFPDLKF
jgi:hypothetical protein